MSKIEEYIKKRSAKDAVFKKAIQDERYMTQAAYAISDLRHRLGLSQMEFAKLVHKPQSTISRIETGEMNPSFKLLNEIGNKSQKRLEIKYT